MSKVIIQNNSKADDLLALRLVSSVIEGGRISGTSYCLATIFDLIGGRVVVHASVNKSSDKFMIMDVEN